MQNLIVNFNILLAQTAQEKKLTAIYVCLFAFFVLVLFIDTRELKKWVGGNGTLKKIFAAAIVIVLIAMVVMFFVL